MIFLAAYHSCQFLNPSSITPASWLKLSSCNFLNLISIGWIEGFGKRMRRSVCRSNYMKNVVENTHLEGHEPLFCWSHVSLSFPIRDLGISFKIQEFSNAGPISASCRCMGMHRYIHPYNHTLLKGLESLTYCDQRLANRKSVCHDGSIGCRLQGLVFARKGSC